MADTLAEKFLLLYFGYWSRGKQYWWQPSSDKKITDKLGTKHLISSNQEKFDLLPIK